MKRADRIHSNTLEGVASVKYVTGANESLLKLSYRAYRLAAPIEISATELYPLINSEMSDDEIKALGFLRYEFDRGGLGGRLDGWRR